MLWVEFAFKMLKPLCDEYNIIYYINCAQSERDLNRIHRIHIETSSLHILVYNIAFNYHWYMCRTYVYNYTHNLCNSSRIIRIPPMK